VSGCIIACTAHATRGVGSGETITIPRRSLCRNARGLSVSRSVSDFSNTQDNCLYCGLKYLVRQ